MRIRKGKYKFDKVKLWEEFTLPHREQFDRWYVINSRPLADCWGMFSNTDDWVVKLGAEVRMSLYIDKGWIAVEDREVKATVKFIEELKIKNIELLYNKKREG